MIIGCSQRIDSTLLVEVVPHIWISKEKRYILMTRKPFWTYVVYNMGSCRVTWSKVRHFFYNDLKIISRIKPKLRMIRSLVLKLLDCFNGNGRILSYVAVSHFPRWLGQNETSRNTETKTEMLRIMKNQYRASKNRETKTQMLRKMKNQHLTKIERI